MRKNSSWQRRERASRNPCQTVARTGGHPTGTDCASRWQGWERAGFVDEIFGYRYLSAIYEAEVEQLKLSLVLSGHRGL